MRKATQPVRANGAAGERLEPRQMLTADAGVDLGGLQQEDLTAEQVVVAPPAIDGSGNNLDNPDWGAAGTELLRVTTVEYADGFSDPAGADRPSAREVSNAVAAQAELLANDRNLTDFVWLWGQFIDHDIDLTHEAEPAEAFDIEVPAGDPLFDPTGTGEVTIGLNRAEYLVDADGVRQHVNSITAYLDGSVVYGSDDETAASLRAFEGGRLLVSEGDLLPIGDDGFFMAGDERANENVALTAMHTLWVREHNRLADEIAAADPSLSDEEVYQQARALVTAQIQAITYNQWLPALLGVDAIAAYSGYDPSVNASIANVFSTAAYRFGHSMLSTELLRLNPDGSVADEGNISLADAFFSPDEILANGIESLLMGASSQVAQEIDSMIVDDVRNFLFGPPGAGGFDLASLNIQRGRDHGLADYNQVREDYGLERVTSFSEITSDADLASRLEQLYGTVDNIDPWVGILAENHVAGTSLGELGRTILVDQFTRIRDGDRYWYENRFEGRTLEELRRTTLSDILTRNTGLSELRENVFYDDSVFYFAADDRGGGMDAELTTRGDAIQLVGRRGEVLASRSADEVTRVVIVGSAGSDMITVDASVMRLDLPGGVVIDGQDRGVDTVVLNGGDRFDAVAIDGAFATFGAMQFQVDGIDRLVIDPGRGPDDVQVVEPGDFDLVVRDDTRDDDRRRDQRDERNRPPGGDTIADGDGPQRPVQTPDDRRDRRRA